MVEATGKVNVSLNMIFTLLGEAIVSLTKIIGTIKVTKKCGRKSYPTWACNDEVFDYILLVEISMQLLDP